MGTGRANHGEAALGGAAAGAIGAMAMTGFRRMTTQLGLVREVPPEEISEKEIPAVLARLSPPRQQVTIELLHWGYGATAGAGFGLLPKAVRQRGWAGPAYGLAIWLLYEGVIAPALGLRHSKEPRKTERLMFALDHVLYGLIVQGKRWAR